MLSLNNARSNFFQAYNVERSLLTEHMRLLSVAIKDASGAGQKYVHYEVPMVLMGAYPVYDVNEITMYLIEQCREAQPPFEVQLVSRQPNVLRVWGWARQIDRVVQVTEQEHEQTPARRKGPSLRDNIATARGGLLSQRLKQQVAKHGRKYA